jgi:hypothetical protein
MLRELGDPEARHWYDHLQQISRYRLWRHRPIIEGLLDAHGEVFAARPVLTATGE